MMDADYTDDLKLVANTLAQAESPQAAGGIGFYVNAKKKKRKKKKEKKKKRKKKKENQSSCVLNKKEPSPLWVARLWN